LNKGHEDTVLLLDPRCGVDHASANEKICGANENRSPATGGALRLLRDLR
jgi:hypothetical protein